MAKIKIPKSVVLKIEYLRADALEIKVAALRRRCHILLDEPDGVVYLDLLGDLYVLVSVLRSSEDSRFDFSRIAISEVGSGGKIKHEDEVAAKLLKFFVPSGWCRPARLRQLARVFQECLAEAVPAAGFALYVMRSGGIRKIAAAQRRDQERGASVDRGSLGGDGPEG